MRIRLLIAALSVIICSTAFAVELKKDGKTINLPLCGGFIGLECGPKEWCKYPPHSACGAGDVFGKCEPRPEFCPEIFMPVCGCDGKTYPNACQAAAAGHDIAHAGKCYGG
ncbi:MAG TPA: Kazal-type serine protease inhibitor domain-containing protein [Methylocystis sp.]|nr:Kazal-type serine protease inhibitor domain-containing protein [Methylocystis sp.]